MAERDPYAKHISRIVDFVLHTHRVKVSWMIVGLDEEEWSKALSERSALDTISRNNWEQISKLLGDPTVKTDIPTLLKLREAARLAKQTLVEYGTVPSFADYLAGDAMVVSANETLSLSEKMPHLQPFTLGMAKENYHVDFLIFINSSRFSDASYDEKLTILAHEAVHIIELVQNSQLSSFESIETKANSRLSFAKQLSALFNGNSAHKPKAENTAVCSYSGRFYCFWGKESSTTSISSGVKPYSSYTIWSI